MLWTGTAVHCTFIDWCLMTKKHFFTVVMINKWPTVFSPWFQTFQGCALSLNFLLCSSATARLLVSLKNFGTFFGIPPSFGLLVIHYSATVHDQIVLWSNIGRSTNQITVFVFAVLHLWIEHKNDAYFPYFMSFKKYGSTNLVS